MKYGNNYHLTIKICDAYISRFETMTHQEFVDLVSKECTIKHPKLKHAFDTVSSPTYDSTNDESFTLDEHTAIDIMNQHSNNLNDEIEEFNNRSGHLLPNLSEGYSTGPFWNNTCDASIKGYDNIGDEPTNLHPVFRLYQRHPNIEDPETKEENQIVCSTGKRVIFDKEEAKITNAEADTDDPKKDRPNKDTGARGSTCPEGGSDGPRIPKTGNPRRG